MKYNILFDVDSYKTSHFSQFPKDTTSLFSYIEARCGNYKETVFFGLQYFIKEYLLNPITEADVNKAKKLYAAHGVPFNYDGWMYIVNELKGYLPIKIKAVPEGTKVPTSNILVSVESTDKNVPWIVSWVETALLRSVWYGTTVATRSNYIKSIIKEGLEKSSNSIDEINFKLHDFGSRGVSSQESAILGGMAHLLNFMGTDTVVALLGAQDYYNADMAGYSIPASEHSSITSWGKENETEAYRNMIKQFAKPGAIFACVSDSYDIYNAISNIWGTSLKDEVINSKATLVVRPDSGVPEEVVLKSLILLDEKFGSTINSKGFKVLNNVRVIQGDGIDENSIQKIINNVINAGYSLTNVAFGMGGALLQQLNRDTCSFAMKCSSITVGDVDRDVFKDPIEAKNKKSKKGKLDLILNDSNNLETTKLSDNFNSVMKVVFENGKLLVDDSFDVIRQRVKF